MNKFFAIGAVVGYWGGYGPYKYRDRVLSGKLLGER